jgi:lysophospholipase L1-like esterase
VSLSKVHCALSAGRDSIAAGTDVALQFNGSTSVTIAPHQAITSDPVEFLLPPLTDLAVSIRFGSTPLDITGHPGSRTTSYIEQGDAVSSPSLNASATVDHWYILSGVEIEASRNTSALVTLGDSITDGRGSTTNGNDRWPDELARRLQADTNTEGVAILNQSIGGNAVTAGGLGPTAQLRFEHDVLNPRGVRWLIVFEGVNDIGSANDSGVASALVNAYTQFVKRAHAANIKVYGATITPFNGHSYYSPEHENARQAVNAWIRDALLAAYDTGDHLHLNPAGYKAMAHAVDLSLFSPPDR